MIVAGKGVSAAVAEVDAAAYGKLTGALDGVVTGGDGDDLALVGREGGDVQGVVVAGDADIELAVEEGFGAAVFDADLEAGAVRAVSGFVVVGGDGDILNAGGVALHDAADIEVAVSVLGVVSRVAGVVGVIEEDLGGLGSVELVRAFRDDGGEGSTNEGSAGGGSAEVDGTITGPSGEDTDAGGGEGEGVALVGEAHVGTGGIDGTDGDNAFIPGGVGGEVEAFVSDRDDDGGTGFLGVFDGVADNGTVAIGAHGDIDDRGSVFDSGDDALCEEEGVGVSGFIGDADAEEGRGGGDAGEAAVFSTDDGCDGGAMAMLLRTLSEGGDVDPLYPVTEGEV